jgi:hypothetical protein
MNKVMLGLAGPAMPALLVGRAVAGRATEGSA